MISSNPFWLKVLQVETKECQLRAVVVAPTCRLSVDIGALSIRKQGVEIKCTKDDLDASEVRRRLGKVENESAITIDKQKQALVKQLVKLPSRNGFEM